MPIKKLVAKQFTSTEKDTVVFPVGYKWVALVDSETGKFYEPKEGWEVVGENLENFFQEVEAAE